MRKSPKIRLILATLFMLILTAAKSQNALEHVYEYALGSSFQTCRSGLKTKKTKLDTDKYSYIRYKEAEHQVYMQFDAGLREISSTRKFETKRSKEAMEYFNSLLKEIKQKMGESSSRQHKEKVILRYIWKLEKASLYLTFDTPENSVSVKLESAS